MFSIASIQASAESVTYIANEGIVPAYKYADGAESLLYISANSAECTSSCTGSSDVVKITVKHTLQKYQGLWIWSDVNNASWTTTESGSSICLISKKSGLSDGTYRVKSVFTLTNSSGKTETITVYSAEKTV
jgi:hypothetical protein